MAYSYSVNNTPATGAVAVYLLIAGLIAAGWTQVDSSDGTTRGAAQVTSGASGTNGLGNNSAWVRLQAPSVNGGLIVNQQREFTFQRGTTDLVWRIKYSASIGFGAGSPSSTQTPNNTDDCVILLGGGTDAAPTYTSWLGTNGLYRWHVVCGGAAEFYSFYCTGITSGTTTVTSAFMLDVMAAGSFSSLDVDPAVTYVSSASPWTETWTSATTALAVVATPSVVRTWLGSVSNAQSSLVSNNVSCRVITWGSSIVGGATLGVNPFTAKDDTLPAPWIRTGLSTQPTGWKGFSTIILWPTVLRTNLDTYNLSGTRDRIYINGFCLPWSGDVPTL